MSIYLTFKWFSKHSCSIITKKQNICSSCIFWYFHTENSHSDNLLLQGYKMFSAWYTVTFLFFSRCNNENEWYQIHENIIRKSSTKYTAPSTNYGRTIPVCVCVCVCVRVCGLAVAGNCIRVRAVTCVALSVCGALINAQIRNNIKEKPLWSQNLC